MKTLSLPCAMGTGGGQCCEHSTMSMCARAAGRKLISTFGEPGPTMLPTTEVAQLSEPANAPTPPPVAAHKPTIATVASPPVTTSAATSAAPTTTPAAMPKSIPVSDPVWVIGSVMRAAATMRTGSERQAITRLDKMASNDWCPSGPAFGPKVAVIATHVWPLRPFAGSSIPTRRWSSGTPSCL